MSVFHTTRWSAVIEAADSQAAGAERALEELCGDYWQPVYVYIRRLGNDAETGRDLTQGFFNRLLEKKHLKLADPNRGRFRTFLLTSVRRFVTDEWDRSQRQKRGGGVEVFSLDAAEAESWLEDSYSDRETPEVIFERQWAHAFMGNVMARLRLEMQSAGKERRFEALKGALLGESEIGPYAETAEKLGLSEGALKNVIYRLRKRFSELVREEVERVVERAEDVDDEIRHLIRAVRVKALPDDSPPV